MTISISKFFKRELRSSRVAYQEHLQTGTTTTRKEKSMSAKEQPTKVPKPKDKRVQQSTMDLAKGTKEADSLSNWSGETLYGDGEAGRH